MATETGMFVADTTGMTTTVNTGFKYKAIILYCFGDSTSEAERANTLHSIGFSDGTNVVSVGIAGNDAVSVTNEGREGSNTVLLRIPSSAGTFTVAATINSVAFNNTNFVVTFAAQPGSAYKIGYIGFGPPEVSNAFVGNFTEPTSTGSFSVTGVPFQGNILFTLGLEGNSFDSVFGNTSIYFGCAISSSKQWAASVGTQNSSATPNARSYSDNANVVVGINPATPSVRSVGSFTGWTADGFTINFTTVPASSSPKIGYLVLKGGNWDCGVSAKPTTATTQTVTGESDKPIFVGFLLTGATANQTLTPEVQFSLGGMTSANQDFAGCYHNDAINTVCKSNGSSAKCIGERTGSSTWNTAAFTSFNSFGWTVTWSNTGSAFLVGWFAELPGNATDTYTLTGVFQLS